MPRGPWRRRGLRSDTTCGPTVTAVPAVRCKTRSQSLKENQEIEIQQQAPEDDSQAEPCDMEGSIHGSREGSVDSAPSIYSSRWSVSSNVSIMSKSSGHINHRLPLLDPVPEQKNEGRSTGDVNTHTLNWVNGLNARRKTATPLTRNRGVANGTVLGHTPSLISSTSSRSDGGYSSSLLEGCTTGGWSVELLLYFCMFAFWAFVETYGHYMKVSSSRPKTSLVQTHQIAFQVCAWLLIGFTADCTTPGMVLLVPQGAGLLVALLDLGLAPSLAPHLAHHLPPLSLGLLGFQLLAVHLSSRFSLPRVNLFYGLAAVMSQSATRIPALSAGPINHLLVTLMGLLSVATVLRFLGTKPEKVTKLLPAPVNNKKWIHLLGYTLMKVGLTIPMSMLLPLLQGVVEGGGAGVGLSLAGVVTAGLLLTPALVIPLLSLCTTPSLALTALATILTVFYLLMMVVEESSSLFVVLLVPVCGVAGVAQNLILLQLLGRIPQWPGLLLATNLSLHTLARHLLPLLLGHLNHHCRENITDGDSFWDKFFLAFSSWGLIEAAGEGFSSSLKVYLCQNMHKILMTTTGCVGSVLLLVILRFL